MKSTLWIFALILLTGKAFAADVQIIHPDGQEFEKLSALVSDSIKKDYTVTAKKFDRSGSFDDFKALIEKDCKVIIVMDNFILTHLQKFHADNPGSNIRSIAAMGLNFKDVLSKNKNIAAVAYEIAGYLTIKGFKASVTRKTDKILGFYRSNVSRIYAEEAKEQLGREKINLRLIDIAAVPDDDLMDFMRASIKTQSPDAVWLVNDNKLINTKLISKLWLGVARNDGMPILCGIKKLSTELGICMYSETPTLAGISQKIVDIIYGYLADDNTPDFYSVEYVQETERTMNGKLLQKSGIKSSGSDAVEYTGPIAE